jgi:hypothetical protein
MQTDVIAVEPGLFEAHKATLAAKRQFMVVEAAACSEEIDRYRRLYRIFAAKANRSCCAERRP